MKYNPQKDYEHSLPMSLNQVRALIADNVAPKKQRDPAEKDYRTFFGKVLDGSFELTPNTGFLKYFSPIINGTLTEVIETKPGGESAEGTSNRFTRLNLNMKMRPVAKIVSVAALIVCVGLLGLALWFCIKKGFDKNWWSLIVGPALYIIERLITVIGFNSNASRIFELFKSLIKK